jgi:integrase
MSAAWWIQTVQGWQVSPGSGMRYMAEIRQALRFGETLKYAKPAITVKVDWQSLQEAARYLSTKGLIGTDKERDRRISTSEVAALKTAMRERIKGEIPIADIVDFALLTALRVGEIARIRWADLDEHKKLILVRARKHPKKKLTNHGKIPLLGDALAILKRQPKTDECIFPWAPGNISRVFREAVQAAGIEDIVFHDTRHEAISRLFEEGYTIPEVALVSGHGSWKNLQRYTQLKPEGLHAGPLAHRVRKAA